MNKKILATAVFAACSAAQAVVVRPKNTDDILVNPDMGLVMFHYSNRQWAYGQLQERGDVLDWFPGCRGASWSRKRDSTAGTSSTATPPRGSRPASRSASA